MTKYAVRAILCGATVMLLCGCGSQGASRENPAAIPSVRSCTSSLTGRRAPLPAKAITLTADKGSFGSMLDRGDYVLTIESQPRETRLIPILDVLRRNCVIATFMMVGKPALLHPELVKRILSEGHSIGSLLWNDAPIGGWTGNAVEEWLSRGADAVESAAWNRAPIPGRLRLVRSPADTPIPLTASMAVFLRSHHFVLANVDARADDRRSAADLPDRGVLALNSERSDAPARLDLLLAVLRQRNARIVAIDVPGEQATNGDNSAE